MNTKKGYFITFEGLDGSGKTTVLNKVFNSLVNLGINVEKTREPGGNNKICEKIRDLVLNDSEIINKYTEALLFAASRSQHVYEYIIPKTNNGVNIICDRFLESSIAYQGFGRKIGYDNIESINRFAIKDFKPDYIFFFNVEPEVSSKRIFMNPSREKNRFDLEKIELQKEVNFGYQEIIKKNKDRVILIDASKSLEEVSEQVWSEIKNIFGINNDK